MPQKVLGGNTLAWIFGFGDLDKLERRMNQDRMLRMYLGQPQYDERLVAKRTHPKALQTRHPLYHPTLHMPGGRHPNPQEIEHLKAIRKLNAAGLSVSEYLGLASDLSASRHSGDTIGVDSWPPGVVDRTFRELFNQIAQVTDFFKDRSRRIDPSVISDEKKRKYLKKLFDCYEADGYRIGARRRRHEPIDHDLYLPQRSHLQSDARLDYQDLSGFGKRGSYSRPTSALAYDTDLYSDLNHSYEPSLSYDDDYDDPTYLPRSREPSEDEYLRYAYPHPRGRRIRRV